MFAFKKKKEKSKDSDDEASVENESKAKTGGFMVKLKENIKDLGAKIEKRKGESNLQAPKHGSGADDEAPKSETGEDGNKKKKKKKKKKLRGGADGSGDDSSDGNVSLDNDAEQAGKTKKKKKKKKKGGKGAAAATGGAVAVSSTRSRPSYIPPAWTNKFNKQTRTDEPDPKRWKLLEDKFYGAAKFTKRESKTYTQEKISKRLEEFKNNPEKYVAFMYQTTPNMMEWEVDRQECTVVFREGTVNWKPSGCDDQGWMTVLTYHYERCKWFDNNEFPMGQRDKYTDDFTFKGRKIHSDNLKPVMPGRGMGVCDAPDLKVIGDIDPSDISQGSVGDCWLLSGISALAEFDGAIKKLFRKTKNVLNMPTDKPNVYTITLWDLKTWKEVDIVIDERLCAHPDGQQQLLGAKPSEDGELWAPYLEKAIAAHAGGWDKLVGGQCTHAWSLLTGCKEQYTIMKKKGTDKYMCAGRFNPQKNEWAEHGNSPHDGDQGVWPMAWPEVGGGGHGAISKDELFLKMVAWDKENYIVSAGTGGTSDSNVTGGLVDNHAYTVIASVDDVAGTGIGMMKVRNPWGKGEIEDGQFDDDGPGWDEYPQIKEALNPVVADDGIFWVTKDEFFEFFGAIYVSASDMTTFLEDTDHQY